jgi:hypothetical protein
MPTEGCSRSDRAALLLVLLILPFWLRVEGISRDFWLTRDQIRDWSRVQVSFAELPNVGTERTGEATTSGPPTIGGCG